MESIDRMVLESFFIREFNSLPAAQSLPMTRT